ncbi:MAG: nicotinate phosphoribosyltransferase [Oscillospiraceae bacterium]|nr:nicotinate phosphoribosyltransferase [Oscillospiraceae bacterium]
MYKSERNLSMLLDFYELTMANGYAENGIADKVTYFEMFFRSVPDRGGFAVLAGLEQVIDYLKNLSYTQEDIDYLRGKGIFGERFLSALKGFRFTCDVWAVPEGTPVFPGEPLLIVRGPAFQAQMVETMILLCINHQSLVATKASRIVRAAQGRPVMEFGSRRAQGFDGAVYGARAAYIGGCSGTACAISDRDMSVPAMGTMAHSWVQMFDSELEAFRAYAKCYPNGATLLVDTYNTLKSGVPNAITVFHELKQMGYKNFAVRIDSGDIAYLSKKTRALLDDAGLKEVKIIASNSLDELLIRGVLSQGAPIDSFGVGERLIASASSPVFGGVYKLVALEEGGKIVPKIKLSENVSKITNPGFKELWRFYDNFTGQSLADVMTCYGEKIDQSKPYEIFDPEYTYKRKTLENYTAVRLLKPVFRNGECVYTSPPLTEIRDYCAAQSDTLWEEIKRFENPHKFYVDLSQALWDERNGLLTGISQASNTANA